MIVGRRLRVCAWVKAGERIDPGARTQVWPRIETGGIGVGTSRAQIGAGSATAGVAAKTTGVVFQRQECVFARRLANLFKALVVRGTAAHAVEILRNDRMIIARRCEPVQRLRPVIARSRSHSETDLRSRAAELAHARHVADNDIRSGKQRRTSLRWPHRAAAAWSLI